MFTGIIQALGQIDKLTPLGGDLRLSILSEKLDMSDVKLGDSIAVNGICLTVIEFSDQHFSADVSNETVQRTTIKDYQQGQFVNLEKALRLDDRLGGHLVSGHVDTSGVIKSIKDESRSYRVSVEIPPAFQHYVAAKGSITVDGVSLTVNHIEGSCFDLNIVPHTWKETAFQNYGVGSVVNLEIDVIARYVERLLTGRSDSTTNKSTLSAEFLAEHGFIK